LPRPELLAGGVVDDDDDGFGDGPGEVPTGAVESQRPHVALQKPGVLSQSFSHSPQSFQVAQVCRSSGTVSVHTTAGTVDTGAVVGALLGEALALEAPVVVATGETTELAVVDEVTGPELPDTAGLCGAVVAAGVTAEGDGTTGDAAVADAVTSETVSKPEPGSSTLAEQESSENAASRAEEERTSIDISKTVKDY
jgi:hypothetical protein